MPRFLIKRVWGEVDENFMAEYGRRSREVGEERFPEIVWEHSHVVVDGEGKMMSYCVYQAADADILMKHSRAVGGHFIDEVFEISGDVSPADFPPLPTVGGQGP